jgi:hypothetical protein
MERREAALSWSPSLFAGACNNHARDTRRRKHSETRVYETGAKAGGWPYVRLLQTALYPEAASCSFGLRGGVHLTNATSDELARRAVGISAVQRSTITSTNITPKTAKTIARKRWLLTALTTALAG